jgi:hypothetical protein
MSSCGFMTGPDITNTEFFSFTGYDIDEGIPLISYDAIDGANLFIDQTSKENFTTRYGH